MYILISFILPHKAQGPGPVDSLSRVLKRAMAPVAPMLPTPNGNC